MFTTITVGQMLRSKGHGYWGVTPDTTAFEALELMADKDIGALLVVKDGILLGVFSERDYARKVILKGKSSKSTLVYELMSSPPVTGAPNLTLPDCMVLMKRRHIRHLPVMDNDVILGVVTVRDVVSAIIAEQELEIEELENYIAGTEYPSSATA